MVLGHGVMLDNDSAHRAATKNYLVVSEVDFLAICLFDQHILRPGFVVARGRFVLRSKDRNVILLLNCVFLC